MMYTVQSGDTLGKIARRFRTTISALRRANPSLVDIDRIVPSQQLVVPTAAETAFPTTGVGTVNPLPRPDREVVVAPITTPITTPIAKPVVATEPADLPTRTVAWGAKVSAAFKAKVCRIAADLGCEADDLMACMAFESGETFSPAVRNAAGSGATGLIQFMPSTATLLGTTTAALARMTPERQLDYVAKYFLPYKGRLKTIEDVYMAILWPAAIGKPNEHVLFKAPSKTYAQNKGLDRDRDGRVTKREAAAAVSAKLAKGRRSGYLG